MAASYISPDSVLKITHVELPALEYVLAPSKHVEGRCVASDAIILPCTASVLKTRGKRVAQLQCDCGKGKGTFVLSSVEIEDDLLNQCLGIVKVIAFAFAEGGLLRVVGPVKWHKHPTLADQMWAPETILGSWISGLNFRAGLRPPQVGALHALAAHWTLGEKSALVVMPTGTGKTEVMLAHTVMTQPRRLLVLVPSDALRAQTYRKFQSLGILPKFKIVDPAVRRPVVAVLKKGFKHTRDFAPVAEANVVISTVAMLDSVPASVRKSFLELFDAVYFDEAHHLRASTWEDIHEQLKTQRIVAFTATPYREDGKRIPLRIVYNFPLKLAQEQKYFRKIHFLEVDQGDRDEADEEIARLAVERLREDETRGYQHIILARAEDRKRAKQIFENIYRRHYGALNPALIYTGIAGKKKLLQQIVEGKHRIVVCVDMFGEGFDLPALKIAAMHDVHRSLAITLQFTGRFTRDAEKVGDATLVANIAETRVSDAIEELYAEDPDWNLLIPQLSAKAVQTQLDFGEFLENLPVGYGDGERSLFDLNIIRPKTSTVIYRTPSFTWRKFKAAFKNKRGTRLHRYWPSVDKNMLVFITRTRSPIEWAKIHETQDETWDLYVLAYDPSSQLLFIHSSQKGTVHSELAREVGADPVRIIDGELPFKVLHGINRLMLYSVGLYGKGRLRFRMLTGLDIAEAISAATQVASTKSNIFGAGYENGKRVTVGASAKGRIWSMSASSIPDWFDWCKRIAVKINDPALRSNALLSHTMVPTALTAAPAGDIFSILPPDDWLDGDSTGKIEVNGQRIDLWETVFSEISRMADGRVEFALVANAVAIRCRIGWGPEEAQFALEQTSGPDARIRMNGANQSLMDYLRENPPILMMTDGSEVRGGRHLKSQASQLFTYPVDQIVAKDWGTTPITLESKWKNGQQRPQSVQGAIIDQCVNENNKIVFDDDDTGETADVVEIVEAGSEVIIKLYHCKYSAGETAGVRVKDLYEVCGQAVRSGRLAQNHEELLRQLERRQRTRLNGRPTRFEKGDLKTLAALRRRMRKLRTHIEFSIVQPGLSKAALQPNEAAILGAADAFLRETTGAGLRVVASA